MARRAAAVPAEERLFSLILALVGTSRGLTKSEILRGVHGYVQDLQAGTSTESLDRKFDRDKAALRDLGIPLETLEDPSEPGNNQRLRYRVSKEALELPAALQLDDRELMLLRLAVLSWRSGSLKDMARRSELKLASLGSDPAAQAAILPEFGMSEASAPELLRAIDAQQSVRFQYRLPARAQALERHVAPLQLHRFEGRWHLLAFDLDRSSPRVFLLSRIAGPVRSTREQYSPELMQHIPEQVRAMQELASAQRASILVRSGSAAEAEFRSRAFTAEPTDSGILLEVGVTDIHEFAGALARHGADIVVTGPPELREDVQGIFRSVRDTHAEPQGSDA